MPEYRYQLDCWIVILVVYVILVCVVYVYECGRGTNLIVAECGRGPILVELFEYRYVIV